jgi:hypothetical protein
VELFGPRERFALGQIEAFTLLPVGIAFASAQFTCAIFLAHSPGAMPVFIASGCTFGSALIYIRSRRSVPLPHATTSSAKRSGPRSRGDARELSNTDARVLDDFDFADYGGEDLDLFVDFDHRLRERGIQRAQVLAPGLLD